MTPPPELFVVGSGRSGTTIVLKAIAALDGVAAVPRLAGKFPVATRAASLGLRWGVGPDAWLRPSSECTEIYAEAGLTQQFQIGLGGRSAGAADAPALRMDRLRRRVDTIRSTAGVSTVVIKNTASCGRVPLLADAFATAPFVHVVRPALPVVASLLSVDFWPTMTLWWDGRTTLQYARDESISEATVAARHWARQVSTVLDDLERLPEDRVITIKYDEFTQDPVGELARLQTWEIDGGGPDKLRSTIASLGIKQRREPSMSFSDDDLEAVRAETASVAVRAGVAE